MKKIFLIICIVLASCSNKPKTFDTNDYDKNKQSIILSEQNNPLNFLTIEGDKHKNLIGQTVTKCVITNNATVCAYKDIRIKMLSYNKEGNMVEEHEDIYTDLLKPSSSANFKIKYRLPKDVDSIALSIMSATAIVDSLK